MYIYVHLKFYVRMLEILCLCTTYAWNFMYICVYMKLYVHIQIATLRSADVGLRAFGSLARRRNPTLAHRNVAHWCHVGPTVGLQPYANPIPPLSNVDPTSVKTIYNHVPT